MNKEIEDLMNDPLKNRYRNQWEKDLETYSIDYINELCLPPKEAEMILKAVCDGAEWGKKYPITDSEKLEIAWKALEHTGFVRGHEYGDQEILQAFKK